MLRVYCPSALKLRFRRLPKLVIIQNAAQLCAARMIVGRRLRIQVRHLRVYNIIDMVNDILFDLKQCLVVERVKNKYFHQIRFATITQCDEKTFI